MNRLTLAILSAILLSCSTSQNGNENKELSGDFDLDATTIGVTEHAQFIFFQNMEKLLVEEHDVKPEDVEEYIQNSINEKFVPEPFIVLETDSGIKIKTVSYNNYKSYRAEHHIDSTRELTVNIDLVPEIDQPKFDSTTLKSLLDSEVN